MPRDSHPQISHPADKDNLDDLKTYLEEHTDYSSNYKQHYDYTQECAWSDLTMAQLIATEDGTSGTPRARSSHAPSSTSPASRVRAPYHLDQYHPALQLSAHPRSTRLRSPPPHHATHLLDDKAIKLNLRLTANLQAKQGSMNSTFYSQYVTTTVQEHTGNNQGYSRYLDNHIGIDIANLMTLGKSGRHSCHAHSCHAQPTRDVRNDCCALARKAFFTTQLTSQLTDQPSPTVTITTR